MHLILAEKPSAGNNFAKALGGKSGTYKGVDYKIEPLFGHMLEFAEPHEMVDSDLVEEFKSWRPEYMPWDTSKLSFKRVPGKSRDPRTGKMTTKASAINNIKKVSKGATVIVIATDKDPSGEGQLIGWELIDAIGWSGPVKRMYFTDEAEKSIRKSFENMVDLPKKEKDGEYVKSDVRSRFDFISMQLTRLATSSARGKGYNMVVRQGRLKSVITKLVSDQLDLVKAYKKKPYFEVKFKDDNGNTYSRSFDDDSDFRFNDKKDATNDLKGFNPSSVVIDAETKKESSPGKLLDLGGLASILGTKGYKSKEILATYQKMYEAKIVSYPRTEDKIITPEQFKEMLPLVDKIADVVGADKKLLTHKSPRKTHVKEGGAHGANRPGLVVPKSLNDVSKFGKSAKAIYETLAKNFLAMFGENYEYKSIKAHVKDYPDFTTTVSVPLDLGYKAIFDSEKESSDDLEDDTSKGIGKVTKPLVAEGVNPKPPYPTHKWLEKKLSKYDVGTGATRVSTLSEITNGKSALLTDTRGKLNLTQTGLVASVLLDGAMIADPKVTEKLFKGMKEVGNFKIKPSVIIDNITKIVKHDKEVFYRNAEKLLKKVGKPKDGFVVKEKAEGVYKPTGKKIRFNKEWSGYKFTDEEVAKLLNGDAIEITAISKKTKKPFKVSGELAEGEYKGKKFFGFKPEFKKAEDYDITTAPIPDEFSGYKFSDKEKEILRSGKKINIKPKSKKTGNPYEVDVSFGISEYKGNKRWGIIPHFKEKKDPSEYNRSNCPFKAEFSGYKLTEDEIKEVRSGNQIMVTATSKKGNEFTCNLSLELKEFKGNKFWGLEAHFSK